MADKGEDTPGFVTLDNHTAPRRNDGGILRKMGRDILGRTLRRDSNLHDFDDLTPLTADEIDTLVPEPNYNRLHRQLDVAVGRWLKNGNGRSTKLVVYPPTDNGNFLKEWAEEKGLCVAKTPSRPPGKGDIDGIIKELNSAQILIIPDLHNYFIRAVGQLGAVKRLLLDVASTDCPVLLGCNSWGWRFLIKALDAQHLLPEAIVPQAHDADQLRSWFARSARDSDFSLHSMRTGGDIFIEGTVPPIFEELAYRSGGVPWVAWDIWRRSLYRRESSEPDVVWVRLPDPPKLPDNDERESLLILHSILIHGGLSGEELAMTTPLLEGGTNVAMLERNGFLIVEEGRARIAPRAYPEIKFALRAAGYPGDGL